MSSDLSPRCPGCGYEIFGLRDMRCPECGRILDVRDFALVESDEGGYRRRLSRNGAIGGVIAIFVVLLLALVVFALNAALLSMGCVAPFLVFVLVVALIWLVRVVRSSGGDMIGEFKRRKK